MLIADFLPLYDFHEVHSISVRAPPDRTFRAVKELTAAELSPLIHLLFALRALPARLKGHRGRQLTGTTPVLEQVLRGGFVLLAEDADRELVLGTVGQFWKLTGQPDCKLADARAFLAFDQPGYVKAAMNFRVDARLDHHGTKVFTETRVHAIDSEARRKFARYWRVVHPGSALIRRMWLRGIKRRAEES